VPGPLADGGELREMAPIADHDEVPALAVLRAARTSAGVEDPFQMGRIERPVGERPDRPLRIDGGPDRVGHDSTPVRLAVDTMTSSRRIGWVAPGRATWARVRRPPGFVATAANLISASG